MTGKLGDFARIDLGFKSLLNDFYYVDGSTAATHKIEPEYLLPIFMLADLDPARYTQYSEPRRWLFSCDRELPDLEHTGAGSYVAWGADQAVVPRKQADAAKKHTWSTAPALEGQRRWYSHAWLARSTRIAIRKGIDTVYAPFLFEAPVLVDKRLYIISPLPGVDEEVLVAYLCSSFFPLALETDAELGLGAGVLTLGTHLLRSVPALPLRQISADPTQAATVVSAAKSLQAGRPPSAAEFPGDPHLRLLDEAFLTAIGQSEKRAVELEEQVAALALARTAKGRSRQSVSRATRTADVGSVAEGVAARLQPWMQSRQFPEGFVSESTDARTFTLPRGDLKVTTLRFMDRCSVRVETGSASVVMETDMDLREAELFVRCLLLGRRAFTMPIGSEETDRLLTVLDSLEAQLGVELERAVFESTAGARYADVVRAEALRRLGVDLDGLLRPFDQKVWLIRSP